MRAYDRRRMQGDDEDPGKPGRKSYKDTKRWCKGKVGREHQPELMRPNRGWQSTCGLSVSETPQWVCNHILACTTCGKILKEWGNDCPDREGEVV